MSSPAASGSASSQAELWGARARAWAETLENRVRPLYDSALESLGIQEDQILLDVGCGAGIFCSLARARGAIVSGLDATPQLLEIAKERCSECSFQQGEMEALPYENDTFDIVTGFNSFQFAANPIIALREAKRVAKDGAPVLIATWGRPEQCEATGYLKALGALMPAPPPGAPGPFALSEPGALERLVKEAGLEPGEATDVETVWAFPDEPTMLRALMSSGPAMKAINTVGETRATQAVLTIMVPFKTPEGGYRLTNVFRYLIARA